MTHLAMAEKQLESNQSELNKRELALKQERNNLNNDYETLSTYKTKFNKEKDAHSAKVFEDKQILQQKEDYLNEREGEINKSKSSLEYMEQEFRQREINVQTLKDRLATKQDDIERRERILQNQQASNNDR